jgi:S-adenosylmethionine:tRNA ribosyltransferase-isomerase
MAHVRTADFDYHLPPELIAQQPAGQRDASRLLVLDRKTGNMAHRQFTDLPDYMRAGDVVVFNDSRVIPARLRGRKPSSGGEVELLLVEENAANDWWTMLRPGKRVRVGTEIELHDRAGQPAGWHAVVTAKNDEGHCRLQFSGGENILAKLDEIGEVPLPPYIERPEHFDQAADRERYQTVYARAAGSVAAPTAGLHFTPKILETLRARGVDTAFVTLHVGLGTFAPVKADDLAQHVMHEERYVLPEAAAETIRQARAHGGRVIAAGTTTVRVLESCADADGQLRPGAGRTRIFIHPPYSFRVVDALITNFHLPQSTLLMLVSAFAASGGLLGRELMLRAYAEAVRERYRFFSYGDAMLIV